MNPARHCLIQWQTLPSSGQIYALHIWRLSKSRRGGPEETNEHADRFKQRSPSGQLPLLAHWSWPELSSQTHHSMSKLPSNMSPCHSTCHTARRGWSRGRQLPHDKATWSAQQTGHTPGPPALLTFGGRSAVSQCQLSVSVTGWLTRLYCVFDIHFLGKGWKKGRINLQHTLAEYHRKICQKSNVHDVLHLQEWNNKKGSINRFTQIHLPATVNLLIVPNKNETKHTNSMTTTAGVETEVCVLAYYWNHLHKNPNLHLLLLES